MGHSSDFLLEEPRVLLANLVFWICWLHELELGPGFVIHQRVNKEVKMINLIDLCDKLRNIGDELLRIDII